MAGWQASRHPCSRFLVLHGSSGSGVEGEGDGKLDGAEEKAGEAPQRCSPTATSSSVVVARRPNGEMAWRTPVHTHALVLRAAL